MADNASLPIACALSPDEIRDRRSSLLPGLSANAVDIRSLENGFRIVFKADVSLTAIAEVIEKERHCCPFLQFAVLVAGQEQTIELTVTGPPGTREFLDALLNA
jgi:hypothetical protein